MIKKHGILAAVLAAFFIFGSAVPSVAFDRFTRCERRVQKAEENLRRAERKHGPHSRQAERRRHELEEARERCRYEREHYRRP